MMRDRSVFKTTFLLMILFASVFHATMILGADWPRWRGPNGNGISNEQDWNPRALTDAPRIAWSVDVGKGYSSIAVAGGHVFTQGLKDQRTIIHCLDAATGKTVWQHDYQPGKKNYPGPRSTPTIANGKVYVTGRAGDVICLKASDGTVLWSRDLAKEDGLPSLRWGLASSPMLIGDRVYLNTGKHGVALDEKTGKTVWRSAAEPAGYATPVPFTWRGKDALAIFGAKAVYAVGRADGEVFWSHDWRTSYDVNAADPIISESRMFISSGYKRGAALLDLSESLPAVLWETKDMCSHLGTPVLLDGHLYGCSGNAGARSVGQRGEGAAGSAAGTDRVGLP